MDPEGPDTKSENDNVEYKFGIKPYTGSKTSL